MRRRSVLRMVAAPTRVRAVADLCKAALLHAVFDALREKAKLELSPSRHWLDLKRDYPKEFAKACRIDRKPFGIWSSAGRA